VKPATITTGQPATVAYTLTAGATVTAVLRDAAHRPITTLFNERRAAGRRTFTLTADAVPDGRYEVQLTASDGTKSVTATLPFTVDRTLSKLAVSAPVFSPNGDGRADEVELTFHLARAAGVRVEVQQGGRVVAALSNGERDAGDQAVAWDGAATRDGVYSGVVTVTTPLGTTSHRVVVRVDTRAPVLRAVSFPRRVFRLSERAAVELIARGHTYEHSYKAGTFSFRLRFAPGAYRIRAIDAAGNVSRTLRSR
jgi:hypothetical protein